MCRADKKSYNLAIHEIIQNTRFVVESVDDKGQPVYFDIGMYEDVICEDDGVRMIFQMPKRALKGNVIALLKKRASVLEDFRANTSSYLRQFKAIHALRTEEYSARNLKDILLNPEFPKVF